MAMESKGIHAWEMTQDDEGYREYTAKFRVLSTDADWDGGPYLASQATGLPAPGDTWNYFGDVDPYSYCRLRTRVTPMVDEQKNRWYSVEKVFSNRGEKGFCRDERIDNPLLQPQRVSISTIKFQEEATHDKDGYRILTSSHEQIRGPQNEWDCNRPQVRIEQNVAQLQIAMLAQMADTVNAYSLWGLPPRTVKFSEFNVSFNYYGTCFVYYTRQLVFDIRYRRVQMIDGTPGTGTGSQFPDYTGSYETFDRYLLDEGTKVLKGHWGTDGTWVLDPVARLSPGAPSLAVDYHVGGGVGPATVSYKITARNSYGESTPGAATTEVLASTADVTVTWDAVEGATSYGVYREVNGGGYYLVDTYTASTTLTDSGQGVPGNSPPSTNGATVYPSDANPAHFIRYQDRNYNTARVVLDGAGKPALSVVSYGTGTGTPTATGVGNIFVQKYAESNLLLLGIPTTLG